MPRFHFHLRAASSLHLDVDGTDLPSLSAAEAHARAVAEELMRHSGATTRQWSMRIEDEERRWQFDLFFADIDPRLAGYSPQVRMLFAQTCRRLGALTDAVCAARATQLKARLLLARATRRPHLVHARKTSSQSRHTR
jgi:hypothetical protein